MAQNIDSLREENRFSISSSQMEKFLFFLKKNNFKEKKFSNNQTTQTIYFLDDEQTISMMTSIKARRYISNFSKSLNLKNIEREKYLLEIKTDQFDKFGNKFKKKSPRLEIDLIGAKRIIETMLGIKMRPFLVIEYKRSHFVKNESIRITIDSEIKFWYFKVNSKNAILLDESPLIRVETKTSPSENFTHILNQFKFFFALPVISKKQEGLNLIKKFIDSFAASPIKKEIKEIEIESKLQYLGKKPEIFFQEIKNFFKKVHGNFVLDRNYKYSFTTASINHYWADNKKNGVLKILTKGDSGRPVLKSETKIIDKKFGIIERKEKKEDRFNIEKFKNKVFYYNSIIRPLNYVGYLSRTRKAFWLENIKNKRRFHITLDRCVKKGKLPIFQIEVEPTGYIGKIKKKRLLNEQNIKKELFNEVKKITKIIMKFAINHNFGRTRPTILEKFGWLKQNKTKRE